MMGHDGNMIQALNFALVDEKLHYFFNGSNTKWFTYCNGYLNTDGTSNSW